MDKLTKFYSDVFGWELQQMGGEYGNYVVLKTGPGPDELAGKPLDMKTVGINGGMMKRNAPMPPQGVGPNAFVCIVGVDDINAYVEKAKSAGGIPHTDIMEIPQVGKIAYMMDPDGNLFGMIQPSM